LAAKHLIPTPAEFEKVRVYLEYRAAQLPSARAGGDRDEDKFTFGIEPDVEAVFGKAPAGGFGSERQLIDYALAFVNGDAADLGESDSRWLTDVDQLFGEGRAQEHLRDRLTRFLAKLRTDRAAAQRWVTKQLPSGMSPLIRRERTPTGGMRLRVHILLRTPAALVEFLIQLLADEARPFKLGNCKLTKCPKVFLKALPKGRGAPRKFCCEDHMKEAHDADAIKRADRSRTRRAAENLLAGIRPAVRKDAVMHAYKKHPEATVEQLAEYARERIQTARRHK
jgi:hypothetical protein